MILKRKPPAAVRRELRQEAGFGCAVCGNPIVEYHHIIPWAEQNHHDPRHMVALCPNHHTEYGKLSSSRSYSAKQNAINIRTGRIEGYLGGHKKQKSIKIGGALFTDVRTAIAYSGVPIFSYALDRGEYRLNCFLPQANFWPEIEVNDNNLTAKIDNFWDIEFKTNWIKLLRRERGDFLAIDFRNEHVIINGKLRINQTDLEMSEDSLNIGKGGMKGMAFTGCNIGVQFGPPGRLHRPNYAMRYPEPILLSD